MVGHLDGRHPPLHLGAGVTGTISWLCEGEPSKHLVHGGSKTDALPRLRDADVAVDPPDGLGRASVAPGARQLAFQVRGR